MASDVINHKYHIQLCYCGKNMVIVVFFNYKQYTVKHIYCGKTR